MRTATVICPANDAPPVDSCYRFAEGGERFTGVVDAVRPLDAAHTRITVSLTSADHERLLAARR